VLPRLIPLALGATTAILFRHLLRGAQADRRLRTLRREARRKRRLGSYGAPKAHPDGEGVDADASALRTTCLARDATAHHHRVIDSDQTDALHIANSRFRASRKVRCVFRRKRLLVGGRAPGSSLPRRPRSRVSRSTLGDLILRSQDRPLPPGDPPPRHPRLLTGSLARNVLVSTGRGCAACGAAIPPERPLFDNGLRRGAELAGATALLPAGRFYSRCAASCFFTQLGQSAPSLLGLRLSASPLSSNTDSGIVRKPRSSKH
jgi:hypothetical protein